MPTPNIPQSVYPPQPMPVLSQSRAIEDSSMWRIRWLVLVDHWVDQNSALTSTVMCEILRIALIKWWVGAYTERLPLSASTISPLHHVLTHWFVGISCVCRWWLMHKVMYTNASQYVSNRGGIFYYVRRVPCDVSQHYASSRISFSLRTKSLRTAARAALSVSQRLEDYWLGLRLQEAVTLL